MLHCVASGPPYDGSLPAMVWARALGKTSPSAESTISRNWSFMEQQKLIHSVHKERLRKVYLRVEDGSDAEYKRPTSNYFELPFIYFLDGWNETLTFAGTVVLLIALDRPDVFELRKERAAEWYGISADTLQRGVDDLNTHGVLDVRSKRIAAPRIRQGWTMVNEYRLQGAFTKRQRGPRVHREGTVTV